VLASIALHSRRSVIVKKRLVGTLLVVILVLSLVPAIPLILDWVQGRTSSPIDFQSLGGQYGNDIPVVVRFTQPLNPDRESELASIGVRFSLGSPEMSRVGEYYILRGSPEGLSSLQDRGSFAYVSVGATPVNTHPSRDVSIPEIDADDVWRTLDGFGKNITGEGIVIADLDSGVDWRHPDLWFADGGEYDWLDVFSLGSPTNGSDAIDLDHSGTPTSDEVLRWIDVGRDGTFNASIDWMWVESFFNDSVIQASEPFFVANDTNSNDVLDPGEKLVKLSTPKTKYIVEGTGTEGAIQFWDRGVNLTSTTHRDTDGHGTAVSGILLGGHAGLNRKYVGVAPMAELMMIKVLSDNWQNYDWVYMVDALGWAYNHGADVILTEIGSWTYHYLDGSSAEATLIDQIVANGVPVISPSGNLGGKDKHALVYTSAGLASQANFTIPAPGIGEEGQYIQYEPDEVFITILSRNTTDFSVCNFSLIMDRTFWSMPPLTIYLHPAPGYQNFYYEQWNPGAVFNVSSFISTSSRGTQMLGIRINGTLPLTNNPPWHQLNVTTPQGMTLHGYISDSESSWTGGCIWKSNVADNYEITWPSTADSAVSVASYRTRVLVQSGWGPADILDDIAGFSSRGPRIDETQKQGVAAPGGFDIISDYTNFSTWQDWFNASGVLPFGPHFSSYRLFSGTSASGPHVAGCAALMLQANSAIGATAGSIIESTARTDGFTGSVHNPDWGWGKLNVSAAVETATTTTTTTTTGTTTTTTTGTTTTTTTGTSTTTTTTTTTTGPEIPEGPDYLMLAVILGVILLLVVISVSASRRRSK